MTGLTRRQLELYQFLRAYGLEHGIAPSFEEIMAALGLRAKSVVHGLLTRLEERGAIKRISNRTRAIVLVEEGTFLVSFSPDVDAALREIAARQNVAPEVVVREAVRVYVGCAGASA